MGSTRDAVAEWRKRDPEATASEMGRQLGVSRARIGQILEMLGLPGKTGRSTGTLKMVVPRIKPSSGSARISTYTAGNIAELVVSADLLARGYRVFGPVSRCSSGPDLIAIGDRGYGRPLTIEVRSGQRIQSGLRYSKRLAGKGERPWKPDYYAVVVADEAISYIPDLPIEETTRNRGGR